MEEWFTPALKMPSFPFGSLGKYATLRSANTNEPWRALVCALYPSATEAAPLATVFSPMATLENCAAVVPMPNATALSPDALTFCPMATE
ncbi:hypothetical protein D3C85_1630560 [compost metagenome]